MSGARHPLPTDIVALVSFDGKVYPNEAKPLETLGLEDHAKPLENALEQWFSFATGQHTWVSVRGATIRGLISARARAKKSAWEVEVLIDAADDPEMVLSLFGRMDAGVIKQRAERVFLRLDADGALVDTVRSAGFFRYAGETLYRRPGGAPAAPAVPNLREVEKHDWMGIYQLYGRVVPANIRSIEGSTFREWQAAREDWGGRPEDLVLEEDGAITAWLRVLPGDHGRLSALARVGSEQLDAIIAVGLARLTDSDEVFALAPEYDAELASSLARNGFQPAAEYAVLAKRLSEPVEALVPEGAQTAIPVS